MKLRRNGLTKYDAPLRIQYDKGYRAFLNNTACPYDSNTMQAREWQRGYNQAYFDNLAKISA